ncbi:FGGY-family carbohydrate kinase [Pseudarthrobacter phenanthrenivorans]|uniref:FGGY-family carbohydrate kinase n=1 Tax=Pseudarthrobacter phenanthrenivorans TaxID=361575 RepID=UPI0015FEBC4E|nr:FGGY family carbohydrate kinase [Pseudarthrobacter phenanthrenivorans]
MFLGIDIGTGSSKAVLVTSDGSIIDTAIVHHTISLPRAGWAEMLAEETWWAEVQQLCGELFARNDAKGVFGVAVSGMGPCLVVTDGDFAPLRPAILYGVDTRATQDIGDLNEELGKTAIVASGGKDLSSQSVGPKLRWIARNEPAVFSAARYWFSCSSFLVQRLTGEYVLDHPTASQCDPLYDIHRLEWITERARAVAGHLPLPRLLWPAEVAGTVTRGAQELTGIPVGIPMCAGTVDAWVEAYSAGVRRAGDTMLMYGSTMFFVQRLEALRSHPKLWVAPGVEPGSITLSGGMATSGSLLTWLQRLFGGADMGELFSEAAATPAGAEGLLLLPYFAGERTPLLDPDARGMITGLTLRHGRGHLLRAGLEGISYGLRQMLDLVEQAGEPITRLLAVGGGLKAGLWAQIVSDISGRPQIVPKVTIGASYGDALMAAVGTGCVGPDTDWMQTARIVEPDPRTGAVYEDLYQQYLSLYPANREHMHFLARWQEKDTTW